MPFEPDQITERSTQTGPPISILAGGGNLPLEVARILHRQGRKVQIVAVSGLPSADFEGFQTTTVAILEIGGMLRALRANGAREMVIAGHAGRPDLRTWAIDWGFFRHLPTILSLTRGGDDRVLRRIAAFFERNGMTVQGIGDVAPELLTPPGALTGKGSDAERDAANRGLGLVLALGRFDLGQAVCVEDEQICAIEGAEGTNGLIERLPPIANGKGAARVLVKAAKPQQDLRLDLPTIGPETIAKCAAAGVTAVAVQAGRSLIVEHEETLAKAAAARITVIGLQGSCTSLNNPSPDHVPPSYRLSSLARATVSERFGRDAAKGLRLLTTIEAYAPAKAAVVARENVLAINIGEATRTFIQRSEQLQQWGDGREKTKRNRTLVIRSLQDVEPDLFLTLNKTKIAGIALLRTGNDAASLDRVVRDADRQNSFVLGLQ